MNRTKLIIAGVAVLAAVIIGYIAIPMMESEPAPVVAEAPAPPPQPTKTDVLVATRELPSGTALKETDMAWYSMLDSTIQPYMITKKTNPQALQQNIGKITAQLFGSGEPIRQERLNVTLPGGILTTKLKPGMRAFTIQMEEKLNTPGYILPNDSVDVIAIRRTDATGKGSQLIARNAKIIAIDASTDSVVNPAVKSRFITLEVSVNEHLALSRLDQERGDVQLLISPIPIEESKAYQEQQENYPAIIYKKRPM